MRLFLLPSKTYFKGVVPEFRCSRAWYMLRSMEATFEGHRIPRYLQTCGIRVSGAGAQLLCSGASRESDSLGDSDEEPGLGNRG